MNHSEDIEAVKRFQQYLDEEDLRIKDFVYVPPVKIDKRRLPEQLKLF